MATSTATIRNDDEQQTAATPLELSTLNGNATQQNTIKLPPRQYERRERLIIIKNVIIIGLAFMIHFTAFHGTSNLQSSVNADKALGTTTLAVIYGSLILSNIFLPMTVIRWFGVHLTMSLAFFAYMPYIAAQFYPRFETLIPAGLMVGFGGGPLWCAKCTYLSTVAEALTFVLLTLTLAGNETDSQSNSSSQLVGELCGARYCPGIGSEVNPNLTPPEPAKIQLLNSIFLICMVIAFLLMFFGVNSLKRYGVKRGETEEDLSGLKLLTATVNLLRTRRQLLILPITMFIGLEEAFLAVDFTKSFVACGWGISNIGFAMICFGVANAVAAGFAGGLAAKLGRTTLVALCAIVNLSLLAYMLHYTAQPNDYIKYCTFAAVWGICDGVWLVVVNAFYGILFPKNLIAGYSNFRLWESTGSVIGYVISSQLCTSTKQMLLMFVLLVGCAGYGYIEFHIRKKQKHLENMLKE
uniref:UNC93-like protein n=1 Tax=Glossina pallidipes TaxID=7398 RepID=A0A1A9ZPF3_GLOPL